MDKRIFFILLIFSINPVLAAVCIPETGMDWCYININNDWGNTYCEAKVMGSSPKCDGSNFGNQFGYWCVGSWYVNVGGGTDKLYSYFGNTNWDEVWDEANCGDNGCSGQEIQPGRIYLPENNDRKISGYVLVGWDTDTDSDGNWCWQTKGAGYTIKEFDKFNTECLEDFNCESASHCDKTGDRQDWTCVSNECENGEEMCEGSNLFSCGDYVWVDKGLNAGSCGACNEITDCNNSPEREKGEFTCEENLCVWNESLWSKFVNWTLNVISNWKWF